MMRIRTLLITLAALVLAACGGSEVDPAGAAASTASSDGGIAKAMGTTNVGSWKVTTTDLGLLSGGTVASARAINNLGKVVGTATDGTYAIQRVMWDVSSGTATPPTVALPNYDPSSTAEPEAINESGEVAGTERVSSTLNEGVYWAPGAPYSVYGLAPLNNGSRARITAHGINKNGVIAGSSADASGIVNAVIWNRTAVPTAVVVSGEAFDVNDAQHVVGVYTQGGQSSAFLARSGNTIDLGAVNGAGVSSRAVAINNNGMIAGTTSADAVAVVWTYDPVNASSTPTLAALGPLPNGLVLPAPAAINDNGDIVGSATTSTYSGRRAVLWRNGQAIQLAAFNSRAFGINNAGQIVGEGDVNGNGMNRALLWTVSGGTTTTTTTTTATANSAPSVSITSMSSTSLKVGASLSLQGSFKDPDNGPWNYTVAWGDGAVSSGTTSAQGTVSASHAYASASTKKGYTVTLTVTDSAGATGSASKGGIKVSP